MLATCPGTHAERDVQITVSSKDNSVEFLWNEVEEIKHNQWNKNS